MNTSINFYMERIKSIENMREELHGIYKSCRKFIDNSVFGKGEAEIVHPNEEEQRRFTEKFGAEFAAAKAKKQARKAKGKNRAYASDSENNSAHELGDGES